MAKNKFGETSLRADMEAEDQVISSLRAHKIPIKVVSEEHGVVNMGDRYLGILDGLDGTSRYVAHMNGDRNARYGTMFAIFEGVDPAYGDFIFSGIMEHPTARMFYAEKGGELLVREVDTGHQYKARSSGMRVFDSKTRLLIDSNPAAPYHQFISQDVVSKLPEGFTHRCMLSSAAHYADIASGKADAVIECTRKGNLEIAVAYGLIEAAGGVMVTLDGKSLGPQKYFEFGQDRNVIVISAATPELAKKVIACLRT